MMFDTEREMFLDWFHTVCQWEKIVPTPSEVAAANADWFEGKAPRTAVDELKVKRGAK